MNVDPLDIEAFARVDGVDEIDQPAFRRALAARYGGGERLTALRQSDGEVFDRLGHGVGVIDLAGLRAQIGVQRGGIDCLHARFDVHLADVILRAFLDREGDHDAFLLRLIARGGAYPHIGIAMGEIEAAQEIAVRFDAVGVVDVVVEEKAQHVGRAGFDHASELVGRKGVVAGEHDLPDRELLALLDLEDEIDALVLARDRLRFDLGFEIAVLTIERDDLLDVALDRRARQRPPLFGLHRFFEVLVLDLPVTVEGDARDGRVFHDGHQEALAVPRNPHVLKEAGGVEALERRIERGGVEPPVGGRAKMRADHRRIDVPVAGDHDDGIRRWPRGCRSGGHDGDQSKNASRDDGCGYAAVHHSNSPTGRAELNWPGRRNRDRLCRNLRNCCGARRAAAQAAGSRHNGLRLGRARAGCGAAGPSARRASPISPPNGETAARSRRASRLRR